MTELTFAVALVSLVVAVIALLFSKRSADAAKRSARAAERAALAEEMANTIERRRDDDDRRRAALAEERRLVRWTLHGDGPYYWLSNTGTRTAENVVAIFPPALRQPGLAQYLPDGSQTIRAGQSRKIGLFLPREEITHVLVRWKGQAEARVVTLS